MEFLIIAAVFIVGGLLPVQTAINAQLDAGWAHNPALTAFVSFLVGTLCLALYLLLTRASIPSPPGTTAPWHWIGGAFGAAFVAIMAMAIPRIGAGTAIAVALAGQICLSLVLDHFGAVGLAERAVSPLRLLGGIMVLVGAVLVRKF
jgi:transporter family-2 protein